MKTYMMADDCVGMFQAELDYMREENACALKLVGDLSNELALERAAKCESGKYALKLVEALDKVAAERDMLRAELDAKWSGKCR